MARRISIIWLALCLGATLLALGNAFCTTPLGLLGCIDLAQVASSQVGQTETAQAWEKENVSAAQRRLFPRLDVDLTNQPKVDYFGRPVNDRETYSSELKLTQPLYSGGQPSACLLQLSGFTGGFPPGSQSMVTNACRISCASRRVCWG